MAPKRKQSTAATSSTSSTSSTSAKAPPAAASDGTNNANNSRSRHQSPAQSTPDPPRRSSRRRPLNDVKEMAEPGTSLRPCVSTGPGGAKPSLAPAEVNQQIWESREGVRKAIKELSAMEERLQSAVKRQRLAVEDSDIVVRGSFPEIDDFRPHPMTRARKSIVDPPKARRNGPVKAEPNGDLNLPRIEIETAPMDRKLAEECAENLDNEEEAQEEEAVEQLVSTNGVRPPPVNSDYLPLPWQGRLGYACLNTYLRTSNPPVFSSRTCRIASILQHRHPLLDPSQPEHPIKNRPDESKPADVRMGEKYVQSLGLANARDIVKMLRWNDKYGIKFMRLSSEMFPFASHAEYGYRLAPFASEVLAEAGAVAAELGHRLTTHPGQFTQLGSPRSEVVTAAMRDLEYHDELLTLLRLPEQQDKDAVMILHMGGTFGDKAETLDRFRKNYAKLSTSAKRRMVLENDDVGWTVHDLLPVCEELNIPLVLDFHHHNILFDSTQLREGTLDIMKLYDRIKATWTRKGITQKMHYSEPCPDAITPRDRRKHSPRVRSLPPCPNDMDLMIEAKDKEQAVFELMRTFRLPGHELTAAVVPFERDDDSRAVPKSNGKSQKKTPKKGRKRKVKDEEDEDVEEDDDYKPENGTEAGEKIQPVEVSAEDFGMGGPLGRVFWPETMEIWLKPKKREMKKNKSRNTKIVGDD